MSDIMHISNLSNMSLLHFLQSPRDEQHSRWAVGKCPQFFPVTSACSGSGFCEEPEDNFDCINMNLNLK